MASTNNTAEGIKKYVQTTTSMTRKRGRDVPFDAIDIAASSSRRNSDLHENNNRDNRNRHLRRRRRRNLSSMPLSLSSSQSRPLLTVRRGERKTRGGPDVFRKRALSPASSFHNFALLFIIVLSSTGTVIQLPPPLLDQQKTAAMFVVEASSSSSSSSSQQKQPRQHRVKRPLRKVPYQHTIDNRPRQYTIETVANDDKNNDDNNNNNNKNNWNPMITHTGQVYNDVLQTLERSKLTLRKEKYYHLHRHHHVDTDTSGSSAQESPPTLSQYDFWVLHTSPVEPAAYSEEEEEEEEFDRRRRKDRRRNLSSWWESTTRNLFDQFVGGDIPPPLPQDDTATATTSDNVTAAKSSTSTTAKTIVNVTTEVEITESVVVDDTTTNNDNSTGSSTTADGSNDQGSSSSSSSSSNLAAGGGSVSSTGGTALPNSNNQQQQHVNTTNITETVIYTENTNVTTTGSNDGPTTTIGAGTGSSGGVNGNSHGTAGDNGTGAGANGDYSTAGEDHGTTNNDTLNSTSVIFQPLRIRAILAEKSSSSIFLNDTERNSLFHDMLSPALLAWSTSLRVDPVVGNLTVDVNQLVDGKTCGPGIDSGLPSIEVPIQHLEEGIPDTDIIVYLSLGTARTQPSSNTTSSDKDGGDADGFNADSQDGEAEEGNSYSGGPLIDRNKDKYEGLRFEDLWGGFRRRQLEDSIDNVEDEESETVGSTRKVSIQDNGGRDEERTNDGTTAPINICTGNYLAAASYCSTDQYDRPTAALLHICIGDDFFDPKNLQLNILTLMHELAHAFGFNSRSMAHFRRPDGTPYTPRDENGEIPETEVECTGPGADNQYASVALPSEEVLQFRTVRGGVRVAEVVTPSVVQVVRNQFDCQLLTGAELESGEGLPLSVLGEEGCIGDHWERRLFSSDLMNPIVDDLDFSTRISTLTLAYFADSGWYQVDLSQANVAPGWGRGAGCSFVNDTCVSTATGEVPPQNAPFFCNDISAHTAFSLTPQDIHGCTPDLSRKAKCSIGQYDLALPSAYQYFNNTYGADVGGSDALMDFCPVYDGYENGLCSSAESASVIRAVDIESFGQRNSRCLTGNLANAAPFQRTLALCLPIACVIKDRSLRIKAANKWHVCEDANATIVTDSVVISCPDPRRVCPTFFCPYDCLGTGGRCDYQTGQCMCEYEGIFIGNETVVDVCGLTQKINNATSSESSRRPFVQRQEQEAARPPPDTSMNDYYFEGVDKLRDEPLFMKPWMIALVCAAGFVILSGLTTLWMVKSKSSTSSESGRGSNFFQFWDSNDDAPDDDDDNDDAHVNPNKDKMVATLLVDMRMHGGNSNRLWRYPRRRQDPVDLNESLADTEDRCTDSEVASDARNESIISDVDLSSSFRNSDSSPNGDDQDLENFQGGMLLSDPASTNGDEPQLIRRRRVGDDAMLFPGL
mmetsp:Transcript_3326/g.7827  ORF Transcript_3326/g.7827 Transcript_3326/m.7827 type:complete len:1421 (-) Transcript_3326:212-4474(-)